MLLQGEEEAHRRECEEREARWDSELADTLATAEEVSQTRHCLKAMLYAVWIHETYFVARIIVRVVLHSWRLLLLAHAGGAVATVDM